MSLSLTVDPVKSWVRYLKFLFNFVVITHQIHYWGRRKMFLGCDLWIPVYLNPKRVPKSHVYPLLLNFIKRSNYMAFQHLITI